MRGGKKPIHANVRIHDTTKEQPMKRLIEERTVLKALPYQPIKDIAVKVPDAIMPLNFETHDKLKITKQSAKIFRTIKSS